MNVQLQSKVPSRRRTTARIVFFEAVQDDSRYYTGRFDGLAAFHANPLDLDHVQQAAGAEVVVVSVGSRITADMVRALPELKLIATRSGGLRESHLFSSVGLRGFDLQNKTLGVVGTGHVGREVIRLAKGFGMSILACDIKPDQELAKSWNLTYVPFPELLQHSDVITLHIPYYEGTHHLLNHANFNQIKQGALLVNTSRGSVIEASALIAALYSGALGGAALDVLEEERVVKDELELLLLNQIDDGKLRVLLENHALTNMPNVILTPHLAFNSHEAVEETWSVTTQNIQSFLEGNPQNVVAR